MKRRVFNEQTTEKYLASAVNRDTAAKNAPKAEKNKFLKEEKEPTDDTSIDVYSH